MDKVPFKYFAKQKNVKVLSISIQNIDKRLKSLQIVKAAAVLTNNINFQISKTNKPLTNSKIVMLKEYHNFLDIFSKETFDTMAKYFKYNYKIKLLKGHKDFDHSFLREISQEQFKFVKKFLEKNLKKKFIKVSSLSYLLSILLAKKPNKGIRFYMNYQ